MAAAGKASLVVLALLMAVAVQQMQAAPAAALRSGDGDREEQRVLHPTCDHDQFMYFMRLSCQYHRRRREVRGAAAAAVVDGSGVRVERSPSPSPVADLFTKCCERTCTVEDFLGVCP